MQPFVGTQLIAALLLCLGNGKDNSRTEAYVRIFQQAMSLSPEAAAALEKQLVEKPDDLDARRLVIEYRSRSMDAASLLPHYLWMVEHAPGDFILERGVGAAAFLSMEHGAKLKDAWLAEVESHTSDVLVLSNAANALQFHDVALSLKLYERAIQIDPKNPEWWAASARLRMRTATEKETVDSEEAKRALQDFTRAMELQDPEDRFYSLEETAKAALLAGELAKAKELALSLLAMASESPPNWNLGNAVHHGNLILGQVALQDGKPEEAEKFLLLAGNTPGSPQLNSFGPNMRLALALLKAGRREAVLEYLRQCKRFWNRPELAQWITTVETGGTPDFGANMDY